MGRQSGPGDRKVSRIGVSEGFKGNQRHAFTAKPGRAGGDGGLVGKGGDHAKGIATGNVGGGENGSDAGGFGIGGQITKAKDGMDVSDFQAFEAIDPSGLPGPDALGEAGESAAEAMRSPYPKGSAARPFPDPGAPSSPSGSRSH